MSITAHWRTATGYNTTDYTVTLGKPLVECTLSDLEKNPLCGSNSPLGNISYIGKINDLGYGSVLMNITGGAQYKAPILNNQSQSWMTEKAQTGDNAKVYRRTIFVAVPTNVSVNQYHLTDEANPNILLVEDIKDPNKLVYNVGNMNASENAALSVRTCNTGVRHTCDKDVTAWSGAPNQVGYTANGTTTYYHIYPIWLYVVDNDYFLISYDHYGNFGGRYSNNTSYNFIGGGSSYTSFKHENGNCLFIGTNIANREDTFLNIVGAESYPVPIPTPAVFANSNTLYLAPTTTELTNLKLRFAMSNSTISGSLFSATLNITSSSDSYVEMRKQQYARVGIHFVVNSEVLKPIITGGVVTGYGSTSAKSELDTYTDLKHPVPTTGGGGGGGGVGGGDNEKNMPTRNYYPLGGGMVRYYHIPRTLGDDISAALGAVTLQTIGKDLTNCLISYKIFAVSDLNESAPRQITVGGVPLKFVGTDNPIDAHPANYFNKINLGSFNIPYTFHDFRDFAPYTKIEIFVPYCGWAQLPPWVMGKTVTGEMFVDLPNGSVKAVIKAGLTVVAELGGSCAIDMPFSSTANGMKTANILSNMASGMTGAFNPTPAQILSNGAGMLTAFNANYTSVKGVVGDGSNISGLYNVYIKVTRPASIDSEGNSLINKPAQYKHDVGIPCNKELTLTVGDGYTQVLDANITGSMTDREKQMIIDGFRHGLIL